MLGAKNILIIIKYARDDNITMTPNVEKYGQTGFTPLNYMDTAVYLDKYKRIIFHRFD